MATYRPELETPLPHGMAYLAVDRGYPVPWFVPWIDGKPEFRAMDTNKWRRAIGQGLCWVCGFPFRDRLGFPQTMAFAIGPMCAINRVSSEPPSHKKCAEWSARNCPFLSRPAARRRDTADIPIGTPAGIMLDRNPGVTLIWPCTEFAIFHDPAGKPLIQIGTPTAPLSWWREGRPATRSEILESFESGLPALQATIDMEAERDRPAARAELNQRVEAALKLLPAA